MWLILCVLQISNAFLIEIFQKQKAASEHHCPYEDFCVLQIAN